MAPADEPGAIFGLPIRPGQACLLCDRMLPAREPRFQPGQATPGSFAAFHYFPSVLLGVRLQVFAYLYAAEEIEITQRAQGTSITFTSLPN